MRDTQKLNCAPPLGQRQNCCWEMQNTLQSSAVRSSASTIRKGLIALIAVVVSIAIGVFVFQPRQLPPAPPLPTPNGYDDFVKARQLLTTNTWDFYQMDADELRKLSAQNAEALRLVRTGLSRECRVPLVSNQQSHLTILVSTKALAQALSAEGRIAELEHRNADAARAYLDAMRLGHEAARGGPLIDGLVRIAIESIGSTGLQTVATNLNTVECREVIVALETLGKKEESFKDVMKNEKEWVRRSFSLYQRTAGSFMRLFNIGSLKQAMQKAESKFQTQGRKRRALLIGIAARAYELEKGQPPKTALDLVPDYLKEIPQDPISGTNMVLKPL